MRRIRLVRDYAHPRVRVWEAIATREALAAWLMPNDFAPRAGHEFTFQTDPAPGFDGCVRAKVLEITPPERLVLAWKGGPLDTTVTFELDEVSSTATRLTLTHDGFEGPANWVPRFVLDLGWRSLLARKLAAYLAP